MAAIPVGRLNCTIEPGTLLGPDSAGELLVAWGPHPDGGTAVGHATTKAIASAAERVRQAGPGSVAEADLQREQLRQQAAHLATQALIAGMLENYHQNQAPRALRRPGSGIQGVRRAR